MKKAGIRMGILSCRFTAWGTVESAKWADFRGVITNSHLRGISHGDMIDLTREDYEGFDVPEFYVKLAEELKRKGF